MLLRSLVQIHNNKQIQSRFNEVCMHSFQKLTDVGELDIEPWSIELWCQKPAQDISSESDLMYINEFSLMYKTTFHYLITRISGCHDSERLSLFMTDSHLPGGGLTRKMAQASVRQPLSTKVNIQLFIEPWVFTPLVSALLHFSPPPSPLWLRRKIRKYPIFDPCSNNILWNQDPPRSNP